MSDLKVPKLTMNKSKFILNKLPPITNVPIVSFMETPEENHSE